MIGNKEYELYIKRCFQLAEIGKANAAPNPSVGAVLVCDGQVIGEGFTDPYGGPHAETICIESVAEKDQHLLSKSTLYVSLEPCNHFGKTPPCTHLIVEKKIPKVVIASFDCHDLVRGKGVQYLKENDVEVVVPVLDETQQQLSKAYFNYHQKKRPYILLNWAETQNGFMAPGDDTQLWISNALCKRFTHQLRANYQAILVGKNTALVDNPKLTTRHWKGKSPLRVIIDKRLEIPADYYIYDQTVPSLIFNEKENQQKENLHLVKLNFNEPVLPKIIAFLYEKKILSLMIEGGIKTLQHFINAGLWDVAIVIKSKVHWQKGISAPTLSGKLQHQFYLDEDLVACYTN